MNETRKFRKMVEEFLLRSRARLGRTLYSPKSYWTVHGADYALTFKQKREAQHQRAGANTDRETIMEILNSRAWERFLDLGCGYGEHLQVATANFPKREVHGCDISPALVEEASKAAPGAILTETDGDCLPYSDNHFDLIWTFGVCIHVKPGGIAAFLAEIERICRGSYFALESSNESSTDFYYFAHDYPKLFESAGWQWRLIRETNAAKKSRLYRVDFDL